MLEISNITLSPKKIDADPSKELDFLYQACAKELSLSACNIKQIEVKRRSIDARKRDRVVFIYTLLVTLSENISEEALLTKFSNKKNIRQAEIIDVNFSEPTLCPLANRPVVVGAGCAGLFAALELAHAGYKPLLIERGQSAFKRQETIDAFNKTGILNTESNIQFGVGGAGTFSDGKLNTGTKSKTHRLILETFVKAGASSSILWEAKPHIGSDVLPHVVEYICKEITRLGGEVKTNCRLLELSIENNAITGALCEINDETPGQPRKEFIATNNIILATGHSARDVYEMLYEKEVPLERKTFAMGVRIEHLQSSINKSQYGKKFANSPALGAAPYKLVAHLKNGRSAFSFCMCPGGYVVAATSEENQVVTNGMSYEARAGKNANSGLLVNVLPEDLPGTSPLAGIEFQRTYERLAFEVGGGNYRAPAQLVGDFLNDEASTGPKSVKPTYPCGVSWGKVSDCLPEYISETLRAAIPEMEKRLHGFAAEDAVLTAIESRSSSPVRITRNKECRSEIDGLWPSGEGAGYAGGIMSAANDGIRVARALVDYHSN